MSHSKLQAAKLKLTDLQLHHRALQYSTESSVCRILAIIQHYQANVLQHSEEYEQLKTENLRLKSENERLEYCLSDARISISTAAQLKSKYEKELEDYRRLISMLKELINSGNGNSASNGDHLSRLGEHERRLLELATSESTLKRPDPGDRGGPLRPRRSDKFNKTPDFELNRRSCFSDGESSSQLDGGSSDEELNFRDGGKRKSKRRSSVHIPEETPKQKVVRYDSNWPASAHVKSVAATPVTTGSTTSLDSATLQTKHCFSKKTILRTEDCSQCNKKLRFGNEAHKCKNCKFVCHTSCKSEAIVRTCPKNASTASRSIGPLSQFAPSHPPYVPKVLATIVQEVEARGRSEAGIYRIPGTHRIIADIMDEISRNKAPYLSGHDIHTVCSVMKDFVRRLDEPVLTFRFHDQFMGVAEMAPAEAVNTLMRLASELPAVNRDTLAFIMLHLKRVSQWKNCSMGTDNLCKIFGPTLIRHSPVATANDNQVVVLEETRRHPVVMQRFFEIPEHFWSQYLTPPVNGGAQHDTDGTSSESDVPKTPGNHLRPLPTLRTINEDRQLDSGTPISTDSDTPILYGPSSVVAHRTRYRDIKACRTPKTKYFTSPLR